MSPSTDNVIAFNRPEPEPEPGFAHTGKAWLSRFQSDPRLSLSDKAIATQIFLHFNFEHFDKTGDLLAWPSWQSLMDATGLKRSCVHKSLRRLAELGAFEIGRGPYDRENKKRSNNRYIVRTSKVHADGPSEGELGPRTSELGPRKPPSKVHAGSTRRGDNRRGESISKKEEDSKNGLPRGPTAPSKDKEEPIPISVVPKPSVSEPTFDVPREPARPRTAEEQAIVDKQVAELQQMVRGSVHKIPPAVSPRRNDNGHYWRIQADLAARKVRREMNGSGMTAAAVSS